MEINAMVVDDSGIMRKLVMRALNETKLATFMFTEATDGVDALSKFTPEGVNIMFVDWNMPNMCGIDLVRKIRTDHASSVPIVMVTTEGTISKVEEAMDQCGVNGYVIKPFTTDVLRSKVGPIIEKMVEAAQKPTGFFGRLATKFA